MQPDSGFKIPQLPAEFLRDMRNDSISDAEFAHSIGCVLDESSDFLRFLFYAELPAYRPVLFERLATERLRSEENRNIGFLLTDLKNEMVSTDYFTQLWLLLCDNVRGEYRDDPEILGMIYGLTKIYRPSMRLLPIAVMIMSKGRDSD